MEKDRERALDVSICCFNYTHDDSNTHTKLHSYMLIHLVHTLDSCVCKRVK